MPMRPSTSAPTTTLCVSPRALAWMLHQTYARVTFIAGGKDLAIATTRVVGARSGAMPRELLKTCVVINIQHLDKRSPRKGRAVDNLLVRPQGPEAVQDALVCGVGNLHRHVVAHSQSIQAGSDVQTLELGAPRSKGFETGGGQPNAKGVAPGARGRDADGVIKLP